MSTSSASSGTPGIYSSELVDRATPSDEDRFADGSTPVGRPAPGDAGTNGDARRRADEAGAEVDEAGTEVEQAMADALYNGRLPAGPFGTNVAATSSVSAEAQQGDGPAAAGASASGVGKGVARTTAVSVVIGPDGAAAACEFGVVVAGPHGAAAASQAGVAAVGQNGAASSSNAANATSAAVDGGNGQRPGEDILERLARLEQENRELRTRLH